MKQVFMVQMIVWDRTTKVDLKQKGTIVIKEKLMIVILRILITVFWAVFEKKDIYTSKARFLYQGHSPARPVLLLITISIQTNLQFGLLTQLQYLGKLCSKREKYRALTGKYRAIMWRNIVQSMQRQGIYWPRSNALMHTLMTPPCQSNHHS